MWLTTCDVLQGRSKVLSDCRLNNGPVSMSRLDPHSMQPPANRLQTKLGFVTLLAEVMHMGEPAENRVLTIPVSVFETAETKEELEDWLLAHDPEFIKEMTRIKNEESGKGIPLEEAAEKWGVDL